MIPWNTNYRSVVDRFRDVVATCGERPALTDDACRLTYRELDAVSDALAGQILSLSAASDKPVGLLAAHNGWAIVGILAILKAGRIYVAFDPGFPRERLAETIAWADVGMMLAAQQLQYRLAELNWQGHTLVLPQTAAESAPERPTLPQCVDNAAIVFTSGSSGRPKGIVISHRQILHTTQYYCQALGIDEQDRVSLVHLAHTGATLSSAFGPLLHGACVCPLEVNRLGLGEIVDRLAQLQITVYHSVPSLFRKLADVVIADGRKLPALRVIKLGGEAVYWEDLALLRRAVGERCRLVNGLGITEAGSNVCFFEAGETDRQANGIMPVGYATHGYTLRIVGDDGRDLGRDTSGEIVVRSQWLSVGYWQDPEKTAAAFHQVDGNSEREYHTGDLGRLSADGCLCYLGRKDSLVKIRGFRVELGEIEAALCQHPDVREAAVLAVAEKSGDLILAAYLVAHQGRAIVQTEIREFLRRRLPDYMMPAGILVLDNLPLMPNGKLDRQALAQMEIAPAKSVADAPQTPAEEAVAAIWREVLAVKQIGVHDNFFDIGGHSLLAAQVVFRMQKLLQVTISATTLFQNPTICSLAKVVQQLAQPSAANILDSLVDDHKPAAVRLWQSLFPLSTTGDKPPIFVVPGGELGAPHNADLWKYHLGTDYPLYSFFPAGLAQGETVHDSLEEMAAFYVKELLAFRPHGPYLLAGMCTGGAVAFAMARLLQQQGKKVDALFFMDSFLATLGESGEEPARLSWWRIWLRRLYLAWCGDFWRARACRRKNAWALQQFAIRHPQQQAVFDKAKLHFQRLWGNYRPQPFAFQGRVLLLQSGTFARQRPHLRQHWEALLQTHVEEARFFFLEHWDIAACSSRRLAGTIKRFLQDSGGKDANKMAFPQMAGESRQIWDEIASWMDGYMGDAGNPYSTPLLVPASERLLDLRPGEHLLDIACGNGWFSRRFARQGAIVTAFDFSGELIALAKKRTTAADGRVEFHIADATKESELLALGENKFDAAVSTMGIMDIADIQPLARSLAQMLKAGGRFVFTVLNPELYQQKGPRAARIVSEQPRPHLIFQRQMNDIRQIFTAHGFVWDRQEELYFESLPESQRPQGWQLHRGITLFLAAKLIRK